MNTNSAMVAGRADVRVSGNYIGEAAALAQPFLSEVRDRIEQATKEVSVLANRVRTVAESVFGSVPEPATINTNGGKVPQFDSRASEVRDNLAALNGAINELRSQVERIESL